MSKRGLAPRRFFGTRSPSAIACSGSVRMGERAEAWPASPSPLERTARTPFPPPASRVADGARRPTPVVRPSGNADQGIATSERIAAARGGLDDPRARHPLSAPRARREADDAGALARHPGEEPDVVGGERAAADRKRDREDGVILFVGEARRSLEPGVPHFTADVEVPLVVLKSDREGGLARVPGDHLLRRRALRASRGAGRPSSPATPGRAGRTGATPPLPPPRAARSSDLLPPPKESTPPCATATSPIETSGIGFGCVPAALEADLAPVEEPLHAASRCGKREEREDR